MLKMEQKKEYSAPEGICAKIKKEGLFLTNEDLSKISINQILKMYSPQFPDKQIVLTEAYDKDGNNLLGYVAVYAIDKKFIFGYDHLPTMLFPLGTKPKIL